jgi:hypothetical protein
MKKLVILLSLVATPALACPDMESKTDNAPRTAEKDKKETPKDNKDTTAKAKEQPKKEAPPAKTDDKAKTAKPEAKPKTTDKVSSK